MNKLLICAYHLQKLRSVGHIAEVHIVTDEPKQFWDVECRQTLSPWTSWLRICSCQEAPSTLTDGTLADLGISRGQILIALVGDGKLRNSLRLSCENLGVRCIVPSFPPAGTLDADLVREVSFFDFEFSGKNEWDGAPTRYAATCLRQLSTTHCREYYPEWAFERLSNPTSSARKRPLKVMDIGCGPVSVLRWGAIRGEISITGVDPLLDMYSLVLARHGLDALPNIRCDREVNGFAEDLDSLVPDNDFDAIYTQNSLDHTQRPVQVIENMSRKLAPHGLVVIQVATREGTRQNWDQLHQTDIFLKSDVLMYNHRKTPERPLLSPTSHLRLVHVQMNTPEWLACILEKH
jgi:SAM-dependent methyltransferase